MSRKNFSAKPAAPLSTRNSKQLPAAQQNRPNTARARANQIKFGEKGSEPKSPSQAGQSYFSFKQSDQKREKQSSQNDPIV